MIKMILILMYSSVNYVHNNNIIVLILRLEKHIGMDLEEIGINSCNWVDSAQDRDYYRALVNAALNLRVP